MQSGPERSVPVAVSIEIAHDLCRHRGLNFKMRTFGARAPITICTISDEAGVETSGLGKGYEKQAYASGLFEAIEHYFHETSSPGQETVELSLASVKDTPLADGCPRLELMLKNSSHARLTADRFTSLRDGHKTLMYPTILTNPDFEADPEEAKVIGRLGLGRYSSNSGTAAGVNSSEAMLHGLLEVIERDAIGMYMLRTVIAANSEPVLLVERDTLPPAVVALIDAIEADSGGVLRLFDITADIGVPTFLAGLRLAECGSEYFGSSASLWPIHAVERACMETVQGFHGMGEHGLEKPATSNITHDIVPLFYSCYLDAGRFGYRGGEREIPFSPAAAARALPPEWSGKPERQLQYLVDLLHAEDLEVFGRTLLQSTDTPIRIAQVVVPKMERFHLVTHGNLVAPGGRGAKMLDALG